MFMMILFFFSKMKQNAKKKFFYKINKQFRKKKKFKFNIFFCFFTNNQDKSNFNIKRRKYMRNVNIFPYDIKSTSVLFDTFFYIESSFFFKSNQKKLKEEISSLFFPIWCSIGLKNIKKFNSIQCKLFSQSFGSDSNLLLSSPTGSGKTIIAFLCIFRILINSVSLKNKNWEINKNLVKVLYIAPFKTIIKEKINYFEESLSFLSLKIMELTGDSIITKKDFELNNIIIGTPEKIDLITREKTNICFFSQIRLLIIDEIHLLNDERGPILEQTILRFLFNFLQKKKDCRIVSLSATFPNYRDLGNFINANPFKNIFYFGEIYREIPIKYSLVAFKNKKATVKQSDILNRILLLKTLNIIKKNLFYKLIIFVHSRKDTLKTGIFLLKNLKKYSIELLIKNKIKKNYTHNLIFELNDKNSKLLLNKGIGIHHAGLSSKDKMISENLFLLGITPIIISTSTLSWGVNLPATHVIIKGTKIYSSDKTYWTQLSNLNIIQMLGRVARIKNEIRSEGILLTSYRFFSYYKKLFVQKKAIESKFIYILPNSFNIECSRSIIINLSTAKIWISSSFFWIRLIRKLTEYENKKYKKLTKKIIFLLKNLLVLQTINQLISAGLIKYKKKKTIINTYLGYVASKYGISYQSVIIIIDKLLPNLNQSELIRIFTFSSEFSNLYMRIEEKEELKKLGSVCIFPIKENSDSNLFKINVLLQSYIFNFRLKNMSLSADLIYVGKFGGRYFRFLFEISLNKRWAGLTLNTLEIYHLIKNRFIFGQKNSNQILNTFLIKKKFNFINQNKIKFNFNNTFFREKLMNNEKNFFNIEDINKKFFFLDLLFNLQPITRNTVKLSLLIKTKNNLERTYKKKGLGMWFFIEDQLSDLIITYQYLWISRKTKVKNLITTFIPIFDNPFSPYFCLKLITDNISGYTYHLPIDFTKVDFPVNYPLLTEFLGLKNNFNFRIFNGFRGGDTLNEYFLSNFENLPFSINQNANYLIKNTNNKAFFLPLNTSKEIYSELSSVPFLFSKKNYIVFFIHIGNESISLKVGKMRKNSFAMLGISVEIMKTEFPGIFQNISNDKSIFISSLLETMHSGHVFKKTKFYFPFVFIFEFFHLLGNINFSNQIEFFFNNIKYHFDLSLNNRFISISFFSLNIFNIISWCVIKFFISTCLCKKKSFDSKDFIKKIHFKKEQNFQIKNFMKLISMKIQKFLKKKFINYNNPIVIGNNSNRINNNIITLINDIIKYSIFKITFKTKIFLRLVKKKKINKVFLYFNFAIINESDKFNERRAIEEFFCGNYLNFIFVTVGTFCISSSQKLNSYFAILLNQNLKIQEINLLTKNFFFFSRFDFIFLFSTKKYFIGYYYIRELIIESKLNHSFGEILMTFITQKGRFDFLLLNEFLTSTFFFYRIKNNPNYYGFNYNFVVTSIFKKFINPLLVKFWFYNYIAIYKYKTIQSLKKGVILVYYFFKEKEYRNILFKIRKNLKLSNIFERLVYIEEITFFLNDKKLKINQSKIKKAKKIVQKIFLKYHFFNKWKNVHKAILITIKKILNIWLLNFEHNGYLSKFFLILELTRLINLQINNYESDLVNQPELNKFTVFLLGKIHKIFYHGYLYDIKLKLVDLVKTKINNFGQLSKRILKICMFRYMFLTFFLKSNIKLFKINLHFQEIFGLLLFTKHFFRNIIEIIPKKLFFYIVIGDINLNKLIFWKKFFFPRKDVVHFYVNIKNHTKKLKIFVFNQLFCYLDREFNLTNL
nr:U5 small nuclear ribonucleoprotein 200 kDa subunit [Cryptomonas curvata]